ncbi:hypothetical protein SELMODRAFT_414804 [Selaginella moellendorffii]|uniref:Reverse transcriptase domain-containing protein n=1 Tax=Selaginella moellendorffii TaxID=88036 RepID=D8RUP0_SELML|nr:hypothetical protein SELMODRAFT_414804 [Selaginella moellendorffii]
MAMPDKNEVTKVLVLCNNFIMRHGSVHICYQVTDLALLALILCTIFQTIKYTGFLVPWMTNRIIPIHKDVPDKLLLYYGQQHFLETLRTHAGEKTLPVGRTTPNAYLGASRISAPTWCRSSGHVADNYGLKADKARPTNLLFVDFTKAFDTVPCNLLFEHLWDLNTPPSLITAICHL